jgi:LysM repeat protein
MNTPSPLVPQGTSPSKKKSTIRIAFFTILVVHVVFIGGLLIQGCTKDNPPADNAPAKTNADNAMPANGDTAAIPAPADPTAVTPTPTVNPTPAVNTSAIAATPPNNVSAPAANPTAVPSAANTGANHEYTIQKGDMLGSIAKKNGVTLKALQEANPGINALRLQVGQKIQIPAGSSAVASATSTGSADTAAASDSSVYTVKSGDRLINIAKSHGTTVKAIASLNGLRSVNSLKVGQKLKMPVAKSTSTDAAPVSTPVPAVSSTPTTTALAPTGQANN